MTHEQRVEVLEGMVDGASLRAVLDSLSEVCALKSQHIAENWQDISLARQWTRACRAIDLTVSKLPAVPGIEGGQS